MKCWTACGLLLALFSQGTAGGQLSIEAAASKYIPAVNWRINSVVVGDFSCRGRTEQAILGISASEIIVAVFLNGTSQRPEVIRDSARSAASIMLTTEGLDFDPKEDLGYILPGFQRSKTCKGLDLSDDQIDSRHIYWNRELHRFDSWSL